MELFVYIALVVITLIVFAIMDLSEITSSLNDIHGPRMIVSPAPMPPAKMPPLTDVVSAWLFTTDSFKSGVPDWIRQYRCFGHEGKPSDHYKIVFISQYGGDMLYGSLYIRKDLKVLGKDYRQPFRLGDTIDQLRDGSIKIRN